MLIHEFIYIPNNQFDYKFREWIRLWICVLVRFVHPLGTGYKPIHYNIRFWHRLVNALEIDGLESLTPSSSTAQHSPHTR